MTFTRRAQVFATAALLALLGGCESAEQPTPAKPRAEPLTLQQLRNA